MSLLEILTQRTTIRGSGVGSGKLATHRLPSGKRVVIGAHRPSTPEPDGVFLVRNSWETGWGDGGYCYIPYPYLVEPGYADSLWTIRRAHNLDFTHGITAAQGANGGCASLLRRRFGWSTWR